MKLASLKIAEVQGTTRNTNPSVSIRKNGKAMFNSGASVLIGYDGKNVDRMYFQMGTIEGEKDVVYLVPAKEGDSNTFKAAKNNEDFQFNNVKTIASLGMLPDTRYGIEQIDDEGTIIYKMTLKTATVKAAEDAKNAKDHTPAKTEGEIKAAMNRRTPLTEKPVVKPTKKELEIAAKKAAKADFKKA